MDQHTPARGHGPSHLFLFAELWLCPGIFRARGGKNDRQFEHEARAFAVAFRIAHVLGPNSTAVTSDDLSCNGKAQARILPKTVLGGALSIETIENSLQIVVGNSRPAVLYGCAHHVVRNDGCDFDGATVRTE